MNIRTSRKPLSLLFSFLFLLAFVVMPINAQSSMDFKVDGIAYHTTSEENLTVEITCSYLAYGGDIIIPTSVQYDNKEYTVTGIGEKAFEFSYCHTLYISESITNIATGAFEYCTIDTLFINCPNVDNFAFSHSFVKEAICLDNVRNICERAFIGCDSLVSISINDGISGLGWRLFENCHKLKSLYIPGSIGVITENFLSGSFIETLTLGEGITSIRACPFGNDYLRKLNLPESITEINPYNGNGLMCPRLESITFPKNLTFLNFRALAGCNALSYVWVKADAPFDIPMNAFDEDVYKDAILYVNKGLKEQFENTYPWNQFQTIIDDEEPDTTLTSFFEVDGLHYHVTSQKERTVEIIRGNEPYKGAITVPSYVKYGNRTYSVKAITDEAFTWDTQIGLRNEDLTSVVIEEGIESIGENAFSGCIDLSSVVLPNGLKRIGEMAFSVTGITNINIPVGVEQINTGTFSGSGLKRITIPKTVQRIGEWPFSNCPLAEVEINGSPHIEYGAFWQCKELTTVRFNQSVASIHPRAFAECTSLKTITLPEGLKTLDIMTFENCASLREVHLPASLEKLNLWAFRGCDSLQVIRVADGGIRYDSRDNCNAVIDKETGTLVLGCKNTVIPSGVTAIGDEAFRNQTGITTISIPEGITTIGNYAFAGCTDLNSVELPQSLTTIGWCAFENCTELQTITIPESVTTMGYWAFWGCDKLNSVQVKATQPYAIDAQAFLSGICEPISLTGITPTTIIPKDISIYTIDGKPLIGTPRRNETYIIKQGDRTVKVTF